jgi:tetratricopeptide (TPR) repeat protein
MWWRKKKGNNEPLIKRIIEESLLNPGITVDNLAIRLSKEAGIEKEAAISLSKNIIDEFLKRSNEKKIGVIKEQLSDIYNLPFSETNFKIVQKEVDRLTKNQIESTELFKSIFDIQQLESEDWLTKGEKLVQEKKLNEALDSYDISIKFNQFNISCLIERGKLLQDLDFHKDAIKDFSQVIKDTPNDFSIIYLRGCSYLKIWELEKAEDDFNEAIRLSVNANEHQKRFAKESGYDSVGSMYSQMLGMINMMKDDDIEFIEQMKKLNNKERRV